MLLRNAQSQDVDGTSDKLPAALTAGKTYRIVGDVDFWYTWAAEGGSVAVADAGAIFVPAGAVVYDSPYDLTWFHFIRSAVSGYVNVAEVNGIP